MVILGIAGLVHDAASCLIVDGKVVAAAEEERFWRVKHIGFDEAGGLPYRSIDYCLKEAGLDYEDIDHVAYYFNPKKEWLKGQKSVVHKTLKSLQAGASSFVYYADLLRKHFGAERKFNVRRNKKVKFNFLPHHLCHAASAFLVSPFEQSGLMVLDFVGEGVSTSIGVGRDTNIHMGEGAEFPHSWGLFYAEITQYLGFKPLNDEYKVMGLASYGQPSYVEELEKICTFDDRGLPKINLNFFNPTLQGPGLFDRKVYEMLGLPRKKNEEITQKHIDIAASAQQILERGLLKNAEYLAQKHKVDNLCMAGGVALNSVANGKILSSGIFKDIFIQPAAHDAGCALGAAAYLYAKLTGKRCEVMESALLGPSYSNGEIESTLKEAKLRYEKTAEPAKRAAEFIAKGEIVGWFQGRMEWGPRALGARSILADPRLVEMKDNLNKWVKHREDFRPFAPSVLEEDAREYFEDITRSPFMLHVVKVKPQKRSVIPAVTHTDQTARPQTVSKSVEPLYWSLINEFKKITSVGVVINTSFNVRGEPIVRTPEEAVRCFYGTGIDRLVIGDCILSK